MNGIVMLCFVAWSSHRLPIISIRSMLCFMYNYYNYYATSVWQLLYWLVGMLLCCVMYIVNLIWSINKQVYIKTCTINSWAKQSQFPVYCYDPLNIWHEGGWSFF